MLGARSWLCSFALLSGCAKLIGIEDYQLRGDGAIVPDVPGPVDATPDAPFGMFGAYLKASNTDANDGFGSAIAVSADGATLVVGAPTEDSNAITIGGDQTNNLAGDSGAVYVFVRTGSTWTQQAYLKPANAANTGNDRFGVSVAVSADGSTIAVGSIGEDTSTPGINPTPNNNAGGAGAVYVFTRTGASWVQEAFIKASNADGDDQFGYSVALAGDGNTLAVGAINEDSPATTINGGQTDQDPQVGANYGAAYVFVRAGTTWLQQAYIKAADAASGDQFGWAVALALDGDTLAVSAPNEDSGATGINGNAADQSGGNSGAAYVFRRLSGIWSQQAYVKASNTNDNDAFGGALALSGDGSTLAVGAIGEDGAATGINGVNNNNAGGAGAIYVYAQVAQTWTPQAYVKASNTFNGDNFGTSVALTGDGNTLLVGAPLEDSSATGLAGNEADNTATDAGAVYAFTRTGATWMQTLYLKATNTGAQDRFGQTVAVTDGLFVVGATLEDSNAVGVDGNQADNSATSAGAVYVTQ